MTAPEVQFTLDAIQSNTAAALADIPLERIDRDNSNLLDRSDPHEHSTDLQEMNYVGAALADTSRSFVDPSANYDVERVVSVRLEGAHVSEHGAIDPYAGTADANGNATWPTTQWTALVDDVQSAIDAEVTFPDVDRADTTYKDLRIANDTDLSSNYSDYYRRDFDVLFMGFETR